MGSPGATAHTHDAENAALEKQSHAVAHKLDPSAHFVPSGGGGYLVASKLLGSGAGVVSGSALLVDYVLTVTVSIAAAGDALFAGIYGRNEGAVRTLLRNCHQEFHDFVLQAAYGRILTRPHLDPRRRELIAVAVLAAQEQVRQFAGHANVFGG